MATQEIAGISQRRLGKIVRSRIVVATSLGADIDHAATSNTTLPRGLVECLVADFRTGYRVVSRQDLIGRDADALWAHARANTASTGIRARQEIPWVKDAKATVVVGESSYFASRIVDMRTLLRDVFGPREYPQGVAVGIPEGHQVVLHPIDDLLAMGVFGVAGEYTAFACSESLGGISPKLYWWDGESFRAVTRVRKTGTVDPAAPKGLAAMFESLAQQSRVPSTGV